MNQENNFDEIDKILVDYFKNEKIEPIPKSIQDSFNETLNKIKSSHNYIYYLGKVAVIVVIIGILSTSVVFAKDIVHFISSLFTNSTEAINIAVENNYVQELNLDYVYNNDIGITIDHILLDDSNLDISLMYKYTGSGVVEEISIEDFKITSDTGKILWNEEEGIRDYITEGFSLSKSGEVIKIGENIYKDSLLISSEHFSSCNAIILQINSFRVKVSGEYITQEGSWKLEAPIDTNKLSRENIQYKVEENKYIQNSLAEMTETSFKIELNFNLDIKEEYIKNEENVILVADDGKEYTYKISSCNKRSLYLEYEIGRFLENIDNFILKIRIAENSMLELKLYK